MLAMAPVRLLVVRSGAPNKQVSADFDRRTVHT
jgi:hypothetical protein